MVLECRSGARREWHSAGSRRRRSSGITTSGSRSRPWAGPSARCRGRGPRRRGMAHRVRAVVDRARGVRLRIPVFACASRLDGRRYNCHVVLPPPLALFRALPLSRRRRGNRLLGHAAAVGILFPATISFDGPAPYPDLLTRIGTELRPGELGLAALARRVVGGEEIVLNAALTV